MSLQVLAELFWAQPPFPSLAMRCGSFRPPVLLVPRAVLLGRHPSQLLAVSSRLPPRASAEMMRTMLAAAVGTTGGGAAMTLGWSRAVTRCVTLHCHRKSLLRLAARLL